MAGPKSSRRRRAERGKVSTAPPPLSPPPPTGVPPPRCPASHTLYLFLRCFDKGSVFLADRGKPKGTGREGAAGKGREVGERRRVEARGSRDEQEIVCKWDGVWKEEEEQ